MTVDPKVANLAQLWLDEYRVEDYTLTRSLAETIQTAIEDWIVDHEYYLRPEPRTAKGSLD